MPVFKRLTLVQADGGLAETGPAILSDTIAKLGVDSL